MCFSAPALSCISSDMNTHSAEKIMQMGKRRCALARYYRACEYNASAVAKGEPTRNKPKYFGILSQPLRNSLSTRSQQDTLQYPYSA
jgi:hypothetical protein